MKYTNARDPIVRQLFADSNKSLIALIATNEANGNGGDRELLTITYVPEQLMLLNFSEELGDDNVASPR